ncbi:MAG: HAD-IC family P-type ATPase, partial [Erysipelotrichia bacterium]|nr:HAD-IC family P-type ATPase [Erysipelotrichia bacterium]
MLETKSIQEILNSLKVNQENGLTSIEAKKRLEKDGLNKLPEKKKQSRFVLFLKQFHDPMIYILLAAAIISFVVGLIQSHLDLSETIIILAIVLLNAIVGFVQEVRAENALEALKKLSAPTCFVRRDKEVKEIKVEELVKGDIVILESGTLIGADIRLLTSFNLRTDESSLTGESLPIEKDHKIVFSSAVGVGDRLNTVYMSTPVVYGHGEGVVIKTGEETEIGQIAKMIVSENEQLTPLQKRLAEFSKL